MLFFVALCVMTAIGLCAAVVKHAVDRLGIDVPATLVYLGLADWAPVIEPRGKRASFR